MANEDRIENYIDYFERQLELVSSIAADPTIHVGTSDPATRVALHKKVLLVAILDSFAALRYAGMRLTNHGRFLQLLRDHSSWADGALVSVPVLNRRLCNPASPLSQHCATTLARHSVLSPNSQPLTAFDTAPAPLLALAADKAERTAVKQSIHFELLYRYRNYIVHEFREPGYAMEVFAEGDQPRYHGYSGDDHWHLLYPLAFFQLIVRQTLGALSNYYTAADIDPYDLLESSSAW
jgi:hypothetical protein